MKRVFVDANIGSWGQVFDFLSSEKNQTPVPTILLPHVPIIHHQGDNLALGAAK